MSEPYRRATNTCPECAAPLREFAKRLVCDDCEGMMIGEDDFTKACIEVAGQELVLTFRDEAKTPTACPRCGLPLTACKATLSGKKLKPTVLRCERDGLWCSGDVLPGVFAVVGRNWAAGTHSRGAGSTIGLDGLPVQQYRPATAGLAISAWRAKPRRRAPSVAPIDPYGEQQLACPACDAAARRALTFTGDRWTCAGCHGAFVERGALEALIEEMSGEPYDLAPPAGEAGPRACSVCTQPMIVERLGSVEIDRCATHGVWFDQHELQTALVDVGVPGKTGLVGWLKRLF